MVIDLKSYNQLAFNWCYSLLVVNSRFGQTLLFYSLLVFNSRISPNTFVLRYAGVQFKGKFKHFCFTVCWCSIQGLVKHFCFNRLLEFNSKVSYKHFCFNRLLPFNWKVSHKHFYFTQTASHAGGLSCFYCEIDLFELNKYFMDSGIHTQCFQLCVVSANSM